MTFVVKRSYFRDRQFRRIRVTSLAASFGIHALIIIILLLLQMFKADVPMMDELIFGGSGGGGGEGQQDRVIQFGQQSNPERRVRADENAYTAQINLIDLFIYSDHPAAAPVVQKEKQKPVAKKAKKEQTIVAENLPTRWVRRGSGPGTGGGTGGGSGGGIGRGTGYSIDWGGTGSRRLLSGRLPTYPDGTDKQMAVILQFAVLPDGAVDAILPVRKTDELLENAAITALRTWRFDPLPSQIEPRPQVGKVTFNFKLEGLAQ